MHHIQGLFLLLLLILPTQSNESVKAPFICDVIYSTQGGVLYQRQDLASPCAVFTTRLHPSYCISIHYSQRCFVYHLMYKSIECMSCFTGLACTCTQSWYGKTLYKLKKMYKYAYWFLTGALFYASDLKIIICTSWLVGN